MEHKIMEHTQNAWAEICKAVKLFEELNYDEATYSWKYDEFREAQKLFAETLNKLDELETFFSDGDKLLPQEEQERLEREAMEDRAEKSALPIKS